MDTIYKYALPVSRTDLDLPQGAELLHVGIYNGEVCLWARVNPDLPVERRTFRIYGTGHGIRERVVHVGSYVDGSDVGHVFEEIT